MDNSFLAGVGKLLFSMFVYLCVFVRFGFSKNASSVIACRKWQKFFSKHGWLLPRPKSKLKIC